MKLNLSKLTYSILVLLVGLSACKKDDSVVTPPAQAHFINSSGSYFVQNSSSSVYKIPVGATTVSNTDRTISYTVSSPTGAQGGAQYSVAKQSVTIPAGQSIGTIDVNGLFSGFAGGRRDTLVFTLTGGDLPVAQFGQTFTLVMQKYCDVDLSAFDGIFTAQDYDDQGQPDGAAYGVRITPGAASGNAGTVSIVGLWGVPNAFTVNLNWDNPANFTTSIADQNWFIHSTYGQVKIRAAGTGTFSSCDNTMLIRYEAYVPGLGTFGTYYTTLTK